MALMTSGRLASVPQSIQETSADQKAPLGSTIELNDGRKFIYCENAGTALASGRLIQSAAQDAQVVDMAASTQAVGDTQVTVTLGTTAPAENLYAEGLLVVTDDTGDITLAGASLGVSGHPAGTASASLVITLKDPLQEAVGANNTVTLVQNAYKNVIITPNTSPTAPVIGVPIVDVAADEFFWAQCKGNAPVLADGTLVQGDPVSNSDGVAGAVQPLTATQAVDEYVLGQCLVTNASADIAVVRLNIG